MPDIFQTIKGGFFDSVNKDRLYTADQMNMPYKKLITDGIILNENDTGSPFEVTEASGMTVNVGPGNALIGGKWAENEETIMVEISGNTSGAARTDSIILRLDKSLDVRAVGIVYRQGAATAPDLEASADVKEFRLANITVANNAASITAANITDTRGGLECPYVTSIFDPPEARYIIEEYNGSELAGARQTVKSAFDTIRNAAQSGQPIIALQAADMTEHGKVYLYEGSEDRYDAGHLYYYSETASAWIRGAQYGASVVDTILDADSENPVQNKAVAAAFAKVNGRLDELSGGMSDEAKHALLACFEHVAWTTPNGQEYYDALELALFPPAELNSISAVYTQSGTVYTSDTLDSLKAGLVVTAHYTGGTSEVISNYTLSGTLTAGTSTITVSYGSKSTTFTVTVTNDNLFDPTNVDLSNFWATGNGGGRKVSNSNYPNIVGVNTRIPVEPSTTYVLSHNKPSDLVCFFSEGGSRVGSVTGAATSDPTETKTFTTPSNCASLAFNINTSAIPIEDVYLILKRG